MSDGGMERSQNAFRTVTRLHVRDFTYIFTQGVRPG